MNLTMMLFLHDFSVSSDDVGEDVDAGGARWGGFAAASAPPARAVDRAMA